MYTLSKGRERNTISAHCLGHGEVKWHFLVTYPGTLGSNLSRTNGTSFFKRNWTAGALSLMVNDSRESLGVPRGLWCQKIRLHTNHIAGKSLQDFHFMNTLNYWQWNIQGQLVLLTAQVEKYLTCHCLCPELFEGIKGRLVSMQSRLRAIALPDCWLVQTISKAAVISGYNIFKKHFIVKGSLELCFKESPFLRGAGLLQWMGNLSSHFNFSCGFQNFEVCFVWGFWLVGLFNQRNKHLSEELI